MQEWFNTGNLLVLFTTLTGLGKKSHIIISIDVENVFDKIQHPFLIKTLHKTGEHVLSLT